MIPPGVGGRGSGIQDGALNPAADGFGGGIMDQEKPLFLNAKVNKGMVVGKWIFHD